MGIFGGQNRVKSQSATTTLIAEGCTINGHISVANHLQIDGNVEGQIEAKNQIKISTSGNVQGEITTERLIINGNFEGICHATYIEILSCGRVSGTVYSDNLSIEPGGKFMGITNPSDKVVEKQESLSSLDDIKEIADQDHQEDNMVLISKNKNT
ncbi:polymer-forming cytoskeletal family protein [Marinomonas sp. A3A]|jgi:cytoskeletal protein CcmA (bactofilin family)|uniref:bactofilin family protein n=1 Tax=Marinomonas TaxID=28253 RepID=UPI001BB4046C|nr:MULTISPECIES: polymer-forming cytoskeletal protein [Marinomonas]QUX91557.1 polymer-forming cytoskeletal family protein [Marinomonas sp. A3A]